MHELVEFKEDLVKHGNVQYANLIKILSASDYFVSIIHEEIFKIETELTDFQESNYNDTKIFLRRDDNVKLASVNENSVTYFDYDELTEEIYCLDKNGFFTLKKNFKSPYFNNFQQFTDLSDSQIYTMQGESTITDERNTLQINIGLELTNTDDYMFVIENYFVRREITNLNDHHRPIIEILEHFIQLSKKTKNHIMCERFPHISTLQKYLKSNNAEN